MATNLCTDDFKLRQVFHFITDVANVSNSYYLYVGNFIPTSSNVAANVYDITSNTLTSLWTNMIMGKQITANNAFPMINSNQWVANTVYDMYDDNDPNLPVEPFFVITTEGSYNHVWKVLDNNFDTASIIQPLFADANNTPYYQTTDGYRWFYMTSVPIATANLFVTSPYFPLIANTTVQSAAVPGAVSIVVLESNGSGYSNWTNGVFKTSDITVNGSTVLYNLSNNQVSTVNGYYNGCLLYLTGGTGQGQWANIVQYVSNTTGNLLILSQPFLPQPQNGTTFEIFPQVLVTSDGRQSVNVVARGLVNTLASNSLYRIEVLQTGSGYINICSTNVYANVVVGVTNNAIVRTIANPKGGHGANVFAELYCNSLGISMVLANNENNTILTTNEYKQIGILKNPLFANVTMNFTSSNGVFSVGETIYNETLSQINANVAVVTGSSNIVCTTANFLNQVSNGQLLYVNSATASQVFVVNTVVNSTLLTTTLPSLFTSNTSYTLQIDATATVTSGSNVVSCNTANFPNQVSVGSTILVVGGASSEVLTVGTITNSSQILTTTTSSFTNTAAFISLVFSSNASATMSTINAIGSCFCTTGGTNNIVVTNCSPNFKTGSQIIGGTSGAIATINNITRNGLTEGFQTFIELFKFSANLTSGTFTQSEVVAQGSNTAYLFAQTGGGNNATLYFSNFNGGLFVNGTVIGETSGASANITASFVPDVIYSSADVLYVENISPVTRNPTQSETFSIIWNF